MAQVTTKTLFFINGRVPTSDDLTRAARIPGVVQFRDVSRYRSDNVEDCDFVACAVDASIPSQYNAKARKSPERPVSLQIVPDNLSIDLSDVEHADLRAMATWIDGTVTDVTTQCAWSSSVEAKATVGAATGIVTPVEAGATVITASYPVAAPGEPGNVMASIVATFAGTLPAADNAFVLGDITYTWKAEVADTSSATAVQVAIGETWQECRDNFIAAVNLGPGKGTRYSSDATLNAKVRAVAASQDEDEDEVNIISKVAGTAANAYATTETGSALAFGDTSLNNGAVATTPVTDTTPLTVVA